MRECECGSVCGCVFVISLCVSLTHSHSPVAMTQNFVELCFYLSPDGDRDSKQWRKQFELFIELASELSLTDINAVMGYADESFAKHCRLCRSVRV